MKALSCVGLSKSYDTVQILDSVTFDLESGDVVALVAPSGMGKSTLLQLLGLLDTPSCGDVHICGISTRTMSEAQKDAVRGKSIGFVYQYHHLLPEFTSLENVIIPQLIAGTSPKEAKERAHDLLSSVGLSHRSMHRPAQLSGGEQQRVAFVRALANNPSILLADEPTGNLDLKTGERVFNELISIVKETGLACLIATHNPDLAKKMDRILTLTPGENGSHLHHSG
ncbi:MAG: Lipoprotein-releasing system ATP-binding protein LolD [Holosporales bacterium]